MKDTANSTDRDEIPKKVRLRLDRIAEECDAAGDESHDSDFASKTVMLSRTSDLSFCKIPDRIEEMKKVLKRTIDEQNKNDRKKI